MRKPTSDVAVFSDSNHNGATLLESEREVHDFLEALSNEVFLKGRSLSFSQANFERLEELVLSEKRPRCAGTGGLRTSIWLA